VQPAKTIPITVRHNRPLILLLLFSFLLRGLLKCVIARG
jgi:hypothetical protein